MIERPTARELEALQLRAHGLTTAQAARVMGISAETATDHLASARRKLGAARNTTHAVARAWRRGWIL